MTEQEMELLRSEVFPHEWRKKFPWYRVSGATRMADPLYQELRATERGVLESLYQYAWTQGRITTEGHKLSYMARLDEADVTAAFPRLVERGFFTLSSDGTLMHSEELEEQLRQGIKRRLRQAEGGRNARNNDRGTELVDNNEDPSN